MDTPDPKDAPPSPRPDRPSTEVFVTSHGWHYHREATYGGPPGHRYTGSGRTFTTLARAAAAGYVPCAYCFPRVQVGRDPTPEYLALSRAGRR